MKINKLYKKILDFCDFVDKEIIIMLIMGLTMAFFVVPKHISIILSLGIFIIYLLSIRLRYKSKVSNYATSCTFIVVLILFYIFTPRVSIGEKKFNMYLKKNQSKKMDRNISLNKVEPNLLVCIIKNHSKIQL